jgi:hypothetical protein
MIRHTTIKATALAELRAYRDEFAKRAESSERKRKALDNAERYMGAWEAEKLRAQPLRRMK